MHRANPPQKSGKSETDSIAPQNCWLEIDYSFISRRLERMTSGSCLRNGRSYEPKVKVSFSEVTVYEFPVVLGDNPSCSNGCPIALGGFEHISKYSEDFDFYNYRRLGQRKSKRMLLIPPEVRTQMLIARGYPFEDVVDGAFEVIRVQELRMESLQTYKWNEIKSFFRSFPQPLQAIKRAALREKNAKSA
jgi:hypothetical protein